MHMQTPLSFPEFPLQPFPNLTEVSKTAESLTSVTADVTLEESDFDETRAFRGLLC